MGTKLNYLLLQELDLPPEVHHVLPVVVDVGLELGGDLRNGLVLKQLKNTSCFLRESKKASHYNSFGEEQNKLFLLSPRLKGWKEEKEENIFGRGGRGGGVAGDRKPCLGGGG